MFKYPLPTPSPEIYNSPATPIGQGSKSVFKIYNCVFAIPLPIVTTLWFVTSVNVENTVVSEGPYPLYTFLIPIFSSEFFKFSVSGSPANITYFKFDNFGILQNI